MGKIGDLWVRLGLKNEEFKEGIEESKKDTEGFSGVLSKLKVTGAAVFAAIGAAVAKFAADAVQMTQKFGDAWTNTMAGVKSAYGTFVRQLSSGEGWDNLFKNMAEAYRKGKDISAALDEIFERKTSFSYSEAEANKYISEQQLIMHDASKTDAERAKAAQNIIDKEKELADLKRGIWADEAKANRDNFKLATGLNDEQTDFLLKNYNLNRDIINQAAEYNAQKEKAQRQEFWSGMGASAGSWAYQGQAVGDAASKVAELDRNTSQAVKDVAALLVGYNRTNDALVQRMADAEIAVINIDTEANRATMRATALLGSLENKSQSAGTTVEEQAEKIQRISDTLENLPGISGKAVTDAGNALVGDPDKYWKVNADAIISHFQDIQAASEILANSLYDGAIGALDELANIIGGIEGANFGSFVTALISPLADAAVQAGLIIAGTGEALEALKAAFANLFGGGAVGAIVAGGALVALGVAAKAGIAAIGRGGSAAGATTTGGDMGSFTGQAESMEMTIRIEGRLRGSDIVLAGQKAQAAWSR